MWQLRPFSLTVDEVHDVIFLDGIHLSRNAVVLIAHTPDCVPGWDAAGSENSQVREALVPTNGDHAQPQGTTAGHDTNQRRGRDPP